MITLKEFSIWAALTLLMFYSGGMLFVYIHEDTHQQIYKYKGVDSEIKLNWFLMTGSVSPDGDHYELCDEFCQHEHAMLEVVGYQLGVLISNLWLMVISVVLMLIFLNRSKDD